MKDLKATRSDMLLKRMVEEGEHENQDFKYTVNDPRKIARTVSAFANHTGGHLLIGVDDNGNFRGVRNEEDIYVVEAAAQLYCEPPCDIEFTAMKAKGGITIIKARIEPAARRPVYVKEEDGRFKAYFRVADENILAHPFMLRAWQFADTHKQGILYDISEGHSAVLETLRGGSLTPEALERLVNVSGATLRKVVVELYAMGLIDFLFHDRKFFITLKSSE